MPDNSADPCKVLEWDSEFFGFRVGRVLGDSLTQERVERIDSWCRENGISCLYFLARADDPMTTRLAEVHGFRLVDIRITMSRRLDEAMKLTVHPDHATVIRDAHPEDLHTLEDVARASHRDTRFFYDASFPAQLSEALYATWIARSCKGAAEAVLVAEVSGAAAGYVTCHLQDERHRGRIGLVGVSERVRHKGIGRRLVLSALDWFSAQEAREVLVVTQGRNCAAQRLYQRCGFLTRAVELWYHKWYGSGEIGRD